MTPRPRESWFDRPGADVMSRKPSIRVATPGVRDLHAELQTKELSLPQPWYLSDPGRRRGRSLPSASPRGHPPPGSRHRRRDRPQLARHGGRKSPAVPRACQSVQKNYSEQGLNDLHDRFGRAAQPYLDTAQSILEDREANAEKHYAEVIAAQNQPLDVSGELRADRHLRRVEKTLQNAGDGQAATTAQRLIVEAPTEVRGTLLQEIPRMLDDRGLPGSEIVAQAAESAIPELAAAAKERVKAAQTRQLLGAEIARERAAQAEHRGPYVKYSDMTVIDRYNPDLR